MSPENWPFDSKGSHGNPELPDSSKIEPRVGEFPKWLKPHDSHIERTDDDRLIVPTHESHMTRKGILMALAADEEDEKFLLAEKVEAKAEEKA